MPKYTLLYLGLIAVFGASGINDCEGMKLKKSFSLPSFSEIKKNSEKKKIENAIKKGELKQLQKVITKENVDAEWPVSSSQINDKFYVIKNDSEGKTIYYETPLTLAINSKRLDMLKHMVSVAGEQIKNQLNDFLLTAFKMKNIEIIELLVDAGADIDNVYYIENGGTLLTMAIKEQNLAMVNALLTNGAKVNVALRQGAYYHLQTALIAAVQANNFDLVNILLKHGADVNLPDTNGRTPFAYATDSEMGPFLLEKGADRNHRSMRGETPIMEAVISGKLERVKFLLSHECDPNIRNNKKQTCFEIALKNQNQDIIGLIKTKTPIYEQMIAYIKTEKLEEATFAAKELDRKSVNQRYGEDTLLTLSLEYFEEHSFELAQSLISKGADVNLPGKYGMTPLMLAVASGNVDLVKLMLDNGAKKSINARDQKDKDTALIIAVLVNDIDIVRMLLESGSSVKVRDVDGLTPVMLCDEDSDPEILRLLIKYGGNKTTKTKKKKVKTKAKIKIKK